MGQPEPSEERAGAGGVKSPQSQVGHRGEGITAGMGGTCRGRQLSRRVPLLGSVGRGGGCLRLRHGVPSSAPMQGPKLVSSGLGEEQLQLVSSPAAPSLARGPAAPVSPGSREKSDSGPAPALDSESTFS